MEVIRRCRFTPYRRGMGPCFALTVWDTFRTDQMGKSVLGYRLTMRGAVVFQGEDFACSPCVAIDSDECIGALMSFLTLRPGDTDGDYFASYTESQLEFCSSHAESLAMEVSFRFGEF
jgi:hypothetical protein